MLKLDPHSFSWWINGPGCKSRIDTSQPFPQLENVTDCLFDYRYIEVAHALTQVILTVCFCNSHCFIPIAILYINARKVNSVKDDRHYKYASTLVLYQNSISKENVTNAYTHIKSLADCDASH